MRKHVSVLMLFARRTLYPFILLVLAMAVVEGVLFTIAFRSAESSLGLDTILYASHPGIVFAVCFLLLCVLLCLTGCDFGSKQDYTLSRLRISNDMTIFWQIVHNAGLLFLLWAMQVGILLVLCGVYTAQSGQLQAAVLVFYDNSFLHSLLPLAENAHLICNLILLAALAVGTACFPARQRRGEKPVAIFIMVILCVLFFNREMGSSESASVIGKVDFFLSAAMIIIAASAIWGIWKEADDEALS
ncbi:MAG: hypothetical protein LUG13_09070 [Oscillospiraceae bacterium]|nr:hypothetical protein [Oscillospiraceae bacterium]